MVGIIQSSVTSTARDGPRRGRNRAEYAHDRVQGWEDVDAELDEYDKETVEEITWVSAEDIERIADMIDEARPHVQTEWATGGTHHSTWTQNIARTR